MLVTDGADVPQAAAVKKARIDGNAARDVELRTQVRLSLYQQGRREANKCGPPAARSQLTRLVLVHRWALWSSWTRRLNTTWCARSSTSATCRT